MRARVIVAASEGGVSVTAPASKGPSGTSLTSAQSSESAASTKSWSLLPAALLFFSQNRICAKNWPEIIKAVSDSAR